MEEGKVEVDESGEEDNAVEEGGGNIGHGHDAVYVGKMARRGV